MYIVYGVYCHLLFGICNATISYSRAQFLVAKNAEVVGTLNDINDFTW